jgi:hypothetical protein
MRANPRFIQPKSAKFLTNDIKFTKTIGTNTASFSQNKTSAPLLKLVANIKSAVCDKRVQNIRSATRVSNLLCLNAKYDADKWSAAIRPTNVKYEIAGSNIQSEMNAEMTPTLSPPKIVKMTIGNFIFDLYMFRVVEHIRRQWFTGYMTNINILDADAMLSVC